MGKYQRYEKKFNKSSAYGLAKAAYSTTMFLKDVINTEYKDYTLDMGANFFDDSGTVYDIIGNGGPLGPGITQGVTSEQRTGDSIKLQRMVFRGLVAKNSSAQLTTIRVIIFRGKAENGISYAPIDLLETINVYSHKSDNRRYDTEFLYDEIFVLDNVKSQYVEFDWNMELNWHTHYQAGTSAVADQGLYMFVLSTENTNTPNIRGMWRISYTDS